MSDLPVLALYAALLGAFFFFVGVASWLLDGVEWLLDRAEKRRDARVARRYADQATTFRRDLSNVRTIHSRRDEVNTWNDGGAA